MTQNIKFCGTPAFWGPFTSIRFLKTIKAEEFQISNGKMLINTSSWRFVGNFFSQVQQFLAWTMSGFTLSVYKLHTQYFSDLIFFAT